MFKILYYFMFLISGVYSHGRLSRPIPRPKILDGGINAPIYTCAGPAFGTSKTSMRCRDAPSTNILTTYNAGTNIQLDLFMEAPHPGDCSIWLSYDTNKDSPSNWIKLKDFPGCFSPDGVATFTGTKTISIYLSEYLPSCDHCVLRWEWYSVQLVSNVEFYVNCLDIKIVNNFNNNCQIPGPTTFISGIEHLLYNLKDLNQKGCPFYNVYDYNIRPPLNIRSRGPKEWIPNCVQNTNMPTVPVVPTLTYPCMNINCGLNGQCSNGICICKNGYTGTNCQNPPSIQCNINCNSLNRNQCISYNTCGNCKSGFTGLISGNTLCNISCSKDCTLLNRKSCLEPNICGGCLNNYIEPPSGNKNDKCIINNVNGITLGITSQWNTGFCGKWIIKCPVNRKIVFNVPGSIRDVRGWNIINMQKINSQIIGYCPVWAVTGEFTTGGFCASYNSGQKIVNTNTGFIFQTFRRLANEYEKIEDNNYSNVSLSLNIKNRNYLESDDYNMIINHISENSYGTQILLLNTIINNEKNEIDMLFKIICSSRMDFDNSLFLHMNMIGSLEIEPNLFLTEPISNQTEVLKENISNRIINNNLLYLSYLIVYFIILNISNKSLF